MKKLSIAALCVVSCLGVAQFANADTVANSTASWTAIAKKDSASQLVVTAMDSLSFNYAQGTKGFNSQKGLFDVTLTKGDASATDFKLTAQKVASTLVNIGADKSTLDVGIFWNGQPLTDTPTVLLNTDKASPVSGGGLATLAEDYKNAEGGSAQESFTFTINGATTDGTTAVTDFSKLPDGVWSGDVKVEFTATWTTKA